MRLTDNELKILARRAASHSEANVEEVSLHSAALESICWELLLLRRRSVREDLTQVNETQTEEITVTGTPTSPSISVSELFEGEKTDPNIAIPALLEAPTIQGYRYPRIYPTVHVKAYAGEIVPTKPARADSSYSFKRNELGK